MGERNKLTLSVDGKPKVAHAVDALLEAGVQPIVVVTGHDAAPVRAALTGRAVRFVDNPDYAAGMSTSLRCGVRALAADGVTGALIALGDMPHLKAAHIEALVHAFDPDHGHAICVPTFERRRGNPVLFAARFFDEMDALRGDVGARAVIEAHASDVASVAMEDDGVLLDVDTPAALTALRSPE
jgi:molybdenum cofactor cytidylyltransferase